MPRTDLTRCCLLLGRQNSLSLRRHEFVLVRRLPQSLSAQLSSSTQLTRANLVHTFHENVNWFNTQYERLFGIAGTREMQSKVIDVESEFVEVTQKRKTCEAKIEHYQNEIHRIRDKLEVTPRHSDEHLELFNKERNLLREKLTLDAQLMNYKDREQFLLDNLSRLLRQSHELERLKLERAKYWQIISIALSLAGSLVAIVTQRGRNQRLVSDKLTILDEKLMQLEDTLRNIEIDLESHARTSQEVIARIDTTNASIHDLSHALLSPGFATPQLEILFVIDTEMIENLALRNGMKAFEDLQ